MPIKYAKPPLTTSDEATIPHTLILDGVPNYLEVPASIAHDPDATFDWLMANAPIYDVPPRTWWDEWVKAPIDEYLAASEGGA